MELVEQRNGQAMCDSLTVAKKFGYKHQRVVKLVKDILNDIGSTEGVHECTPKSLTEEREYRGQSYTVYLMNRDFFTLLMMRFKGNKAFKWQMAFIAAFNTMEQHIVASLENKKSPEWISKRVQGKIARREETDVIKDFVEYATLQGSRSATFYYKHITNATYSALGMMVQRKPKLRDTLNLYELSELLLAERVAQASLKKYMNMGRHYKDIYTSVKDDLVMFGDSIKISK